MIEISVLSLQIGGLVRNLQRDVSFFYFGECYLGSFCQSGKVLTHECLKEPKESF